MTALENVEQPTDALPVDAVLRRAAASVYTLFDFPTLSLFHTFRTIARALANSPGLLLLDEPTSDLVAYTSWYVFVRDVMVASEKRMKEEDIRNTLLMKKALAGLHSVKTWKKKDGQAGGMLGEEGKGREERMHSDWMIPVCSSVHEPWDNDHVAFCSREDEEGMACVFEIIVEEQGDTKTLFRQFSLNANPFSNQRMGTIRIDIQERPQFISQTCISAVLLNSSPLTDLASIVAEVDANEVFMLHKTNMLEEIGAENELMERSCAGMMDWIGMGGLPEVDEEEEERRKETEAKEEEERLREERKEQELNKVAEETNEQEKRAKEAQPQLRTNTHLTSHSTTVCVAARPPSFLSPLHTALLHLTPPHPPSSNTARTCLPPAPSQPTPSLHQRWGNEELLMIRSDVQATHNEDNRDELDQYSYSLLGDYE
ncbi:hypothetical protein BLNAU_21525 [Blattamonas nauphoetae]|uniref:Uncharacterized protein n=1 Tax=Blattamonas nauphoetae TaxID=2049346 RepID=A0ABQ9WW62_9EUKA|nr:hypothetical protein BLNAU_21525 [Blattamonas nauphoetae]